MDNQFWICGAIVSAVLHGLILAVLFVFGSDGRPRAVEEVSPRPEESVQAEPSVAPAAETQPKPAAETQPRPAALPDPAASSTSEYVVRAGDTLGGIARRIGCSVSRLAEVNGSDVKTLSRLQIGQRLVLPD